MTYEMTGTVKLIMDTMTFNSGFTKREFVIRVEEGRFPQEIKFQCVRDRINALNGIKAGDVVKIGFEVRGHEWNEKYFVDLEAVSVSKVDADGTSVTMDEPAPPPADDLAAAGGSMAEDNFADDDMPF